MLGVLILSRDCLSASHDYGISESQNLIGNGSFEGEGNWHARPVKPDEGVFHAVRDWKFHHRLMGWKKKKESDCVLPPSLGRNPVSGKPEHCLEVPNS